MLTHSFVISFVTEARELSHSFVSFPLFYFFCLSSLWGQRQKGGGDPCGHSLVLGLFERVELLFLAAQLRRLGKDSASYKRPSLMYLPQKSNTHTKHPQASRFYISLLSIIFRGYHLTTGEAYGMRNTPSN